MDFEKLEKFLGASVIILIAILFIVCLIANVFYSNYKEGVTSEDILTAEKIECAHYGMEVKTKVQYLRPRGNTDTTICSDGFNEKVLKYDTIEWCKLTVGYPNHCVNMRS